MSIQALRDQRAAQAKTLNDLVKDGDGKTWTDANQATYDDGMKALDQIDAAIKRIVDLNARIVEDATREEIADKADKHAKDKRSPAAAVFAKWLRGGTTGLSADDVQVFRNTMSTSTGSEGGYTVPIETASTLIEALKQFGGMRDAATVLPTATGHDMNFPTADATSEIGEIVGQNASATAADTTFGTLPLIVFKYSSKSVAVPIELLQDSNIDIEGYVNRLLVTRLGRITNTHFTTGTGSGQPNGIVTASAIGFTAANGGGEVLTFKYDSLVEVQHSVDPAYRMMGKAKWMFRDATLKSLRQIKDANGRPIFVPGYETSSPGGAPDMLLGSPIVINQDVASMAAGAKSVLFGNFDAYTIRDALDVIIRRFDDSAFALKGQVGFCAWLRSGGNLLDVGGAVKVLKNAAS